MPTLTATIVDRNGFPIDDDVVPDGGALRVPLPYMDHMAQEVRRALQDEKPVLHDGMGNPAGYRAGYVFGDDQSERRRANARALYIRELQDAWRSKPRQPKPANASPTDNELSTTGDARVDAYSDYKQRIANAWRTVR